MAEFFAAKCWNYIWPFAGALFLTLVLTPLVKRLNMRLGMVDMPNERRINKMPVVRGGGVALVAGVIASYAVFVSLVGVDPLPGQAFFGPVRFWRLNSKHTG